MTGQPAVSLPLHQSPDGLPMTGQLEQAAPWRDRHPPLWDAPPA